MRCILLYHPDVAKHGFQYVDWLFDGDDIIAACRTAYDDGPAARTTTTTPTSSTFHRIAGFPQMDRTGRGSSQGRSQGRGQGRSQGERVSLGVLPMHL